jgi:hypothetical protein
MPFLLALQNNNLPPYYKTGENLMEKFLFFVLLYFASAQIHLVAQIDTHTPSNWSNVGYHGAIPRTFDQIINVKTAYNLKGDGVTDDAALLQQAINNKSTNYGSQFVVFFFPEGNYVLGSSISIPASASKLVLIGQGSDRTKFTATHSGKVFNVVAEPQNGLTAIPSTNYTQYSRGSTSIQVPFTGVQQGDFIEIVVDDGNWHGNYGPENSKPVVQCSVGQIVKVLTSSSVGNVSNITLEDPLRLDYGINDGIDLHPKAQKINPVHDIGFENFSVINSNESDWIDDGYNFFFKYSVDCWIWGVESQKPLKAHVNIGQSSAIEIRGCYFFNALKFGGGGQGYGITINTHSTNCLIEDNIFKLLRHAMMVQGGANGNVFGYNFSDEQKGITYNTIYIGGWPIIIESEEYDDGDISFHGTYPYDNLFEGNIALFADGDRHWGANGPRNALFRNEIRRSPQIACQNFYDWPNGYKASSGGIRLIGPYVGGTYQPQDYYVYGNTTKKNQCTTIPVSYKQANYFTANEADFDNSNVVLGEVGINSNTTGYSMYYGSKPEHFLSASYSWPPVGCKDPTSIAPPQNIPAKDRFVQIVKTSLAGPFSIGNTYRITVENDLNGVKTVGKVGAHETINGTPQWSSQTSPYPFYFPQNTNQQIRTESHYLPYSSNDYRHLNWNLDGNSISLQTTVSVDGTKPQTAYFKPAKPLTLQTNADGPVNVIFRGAVKIPPYSDYGFQSPLTTEIGVQLTSPNGQENYQFLGWSDGDMNLNRSISLASVTTLTANLKAHQATSNALALKNNGQRKIVRTVNGNVYSFYESIGKIWLERKANGGSSWELQQVSDFWTSDASNPSASMYGNKLLIVYQEKNGNNNTDLKLSIIDENETVTIVDISLDIPTYSNNCSPVVASTQNGKILIVWKQGSVGLFYRFAQYENGVFVWKTNPLQLTDDAGVAANAINPTLAAENTSYADFFNFHLAFQSSSHIYYRLLRQRPNGNFEQVETSRNVSSNCGYSSNYQPSIISFDNGARIAWYGRRWVPSEEGLAKSAIEDGEWIYNTILTDPSNSTYFWSWGNNVGSVSFNKYTVGTDDQNYVIGWTENNGASAKYIRSISFSEINTFVLPSGTAISGSKDIQVTNGESFGTMYGYFLTEGSPNKFVLSKDLLPIQSKQQSQPIYSGREGIIAKDSAQFYFTFGDVLVDGKLIRFTTIPDTTNIDSLPIVNQYLTTENFNLTGQSNFLYGVRYGITDSLAAIAALQNGNTVRFSVELIDAQTEQVIGTYDDIEYTENNVFQYDNIGYQVNTSGIGSRVVKLRLKVSLTDSVHYSITERYDTEIFLGKRGSNRVAIGFQGSNVITSYSLEQNFPNPFNPTTMINYALPKAGNVVLKVYDVLGKEVATLINDFKESGRYSVEFDASKLSSGMYIYKLTSDKFTEVKKMMLVK